MKHQIASILLALTCATTSSCGTLSSIETTLAETDWQAVLNTASATYANVAGSLFKLCADENLPEALNPVCTGLYKIDFAAEQALAIASLAIETGDNVSAAVQEAQDRVNALEGAFKVLKTERTKSELRTRALTRGMAPEAEAMPNPYKSKAAALRSAATAEKVAQ